jgi:hypothetical protein
LDNVNKDVKYLAVLLVTGLQDDIVPALLSVKTAAALQLASGDAEGKKNEGV